MPRIAILGTRGIPACHGGFETFAEHLALYLVGRGWNVTVYCQGEGKGDVVEDEWRGVRLVHIPVSQTGALGTIAFDWKSTWHAAREQGLVLTLGYNTALFCAIYRIKGIINLINMDGVEWQREKWNAIERAWLYLNEWVGCWLGNHLIADHPEIKRHLATRVAGGKISMIPYGADAVESANDLLLEPFELTPYSYVLVIARPEPENSILEIVAAFSRRKRGFKLVLLGKYEPDKNDYHRKVASAASEEVVFLGAVYDKQTVAALRYFCRLYVHGHQVGGTNPSLVEALGAGSPVLAHDNRFNRWVAGDGARYFRDEEECSRKLDALLDDRDELSAMSKASRQRFRDAFTWDEVLTKYEKLLARWANHRA